ncbi:uncharacterized protein RHOBADRAFT_50507 [Rhodotorula graminis WP1]|uniref:DUF676 domain-containing protein n=1 Tax=Rhodotorula graminis (strain WP1) TaxID=578459 RepID=A0A194SB84_RHOGW|nr:uncharacterized protein RHOBADRAFT_50507 [Rhodotorula graminis WP1]KPV77983.1 hypothetical protein RHOBADRAFT_50507 [Rhodotorula graminis WP1]
MLASSSSSCCTEHHGTSSPSPHSAAVHLVVILHGLFGSPKHVAYLASALEREAAAQLKARGDDEDGRKLVVLVVQSNGLSSAHLYDGIDVCAARVVEEVDAEVERIERQGGRVERFSMVGYSLGGLVARYALGILDSRTPSFFDSAVPTSFTTFASPAIGVPVYPDSRFSRFARAVGSSLLSRTGRQLYERDVYLPAALCDGEVEDERAGRRRDDEQKRRGDPLLKVMADPRFSFYRALAKFERFDLFANTVNDRTVPFPTGGIEAHDPFAKALHKVKVLAQERDDDPDAALDLREGGLELPLALVFIATLPLVYPIALIALISRSLLQIPQSGRRIRRARLKVDGGRDGWLARAGINAEEMVELLQATAQDEAHLVTGRCDKAPTTSSSASSSAALLVDEGDGDAQDSASSTAAPDSATASTDPALSASQLFQVKSLNSLPNLHKHYVHLIDTIWAHGAIICRNPKHPAQSCTEVVDWWARRFEI